MPKYCAFEPPKPHLHVATVIQDLPVGMELEAIRTMFAHDDSLPATVAWRGVAGTIRDKASVERINAVGIDGALYFTLDWSEPGKVTFMFFV